MRHTFEVQVGPVAFRVGSDWRSPIDALAALYAPYRRPRGACDFTVRLEAAKPWRRWLRPAVTIGGDFALPDAAPLPLEHGLLAAEMGMNLQMALGQRRFLLLHAATVERDGRALVLTGASGSGKSTLSALLAQRGWRFLGDEFALLEPATGLIHPFPRPVSLKNGAIALLKAVAEQRVGPLLSGTPKGDIRHLRPPEAAIEAMAEPARPALLLFPRFGRELTAEVRPVGMAEAFVRLTQASTNYVALGESGFTALTRLVTSIPSSAIDYPDADAAFGLVDQLWAEKS